jgi:anti-sigma-28 factor FlgM
MDDETKTKTVKIAELKAQIERAAYDVDIDAVAEAFVSRMLAVRGALRRADVRALLGDAAAAELQLPA